MRPERYHRGTFDVGAQVANEHEEGEADEDRGKEKMAARPEDLGKFIAVAIDHFEQTFAITPE